MRESASYRIGDLGWTSGPSHPAMGLLESHASLGVMSGGLSIIHGRDSETKKIKEKIVLANSIIVTGLVVRDFRSKTWYLDKKIKPRA